MKADFFVLGHFDQNKENKKWNEPDKSKALKTKEALL